MAPNRPTSPTGMLWAHQLKREHGFLLDRMKKLESEITKVESTAKSAKDATASHDIAAIASKVKALSEDGGSKATEQLREEVMERLENIAAEMEAITLKVAAIDEDSESVEEERRRAFSNEKALLKRVKEVEEHLNQYEKNLNRIGDQVNEQQMDVIRAQLADLLDQVKGEGAERGAFKDSLQVLEQVTRELKKDNEKLVKEIKALRKRPVAPTVAVQPTAMVASAPKSAYNALPVIDRDEQATTNRMPPPPPAIQKGVKRVFGTACSACRKSHLRCTHGSNAAGAVEEDAEEEDIPEAPAPRRTGAANTKSNPAPTRKENTRTAKAIKQEAAEAQGLQATTKAPAARGLQREIQDLRSASQFIKKEADTQRPVQKQVIASGRGWVVERTPSDGQNAEPAQTSQDSTKGLTAAERVKRGRGRPRKNPQEPPPQASAAPKRGRGRPPKNPSQISTQVTQTSQTDTPKRGRGRPRKDATQLLKLVETPKRERGRGRPRKDAAQTPAAVRSSPPPRQIKQEFVESRQQPLRDVTAAQTTERPMPVKKEPGREKKQSALEALREKLAAGRSGGMGSSSSVLSSAQPSPPKRKAVEPPAQQRRPKRRTMEQDVDDDD
ncbi:hypothetical protein M409DRAFT_30183 [Zasmidium cellare ATCC 36951]|uniref:Uncharacterized protein n=1 Tax=Zasmidium cellare ATCC 36951 TaxID=1080233 RepID=A0A6A6C0S6_ZASCE|nr:uncharacterized protein M409DRAFT_30183 [Zasmidium cellare ATCC 36951]KAF2159306.1 hypothetical protein M409DRAFT_30183 [Zasmidium cellare ATCC 36951]